MENPLVWEGQAEKGIYKGVLFRRNTHFTPFPLCLPLCRLLAHLGLGETRAGHLVWGGTGPAGPRQLGPATPSPSPCSPFSNPHRSPAPPPAPASRRDGDTALKALGTRERTAALGPPSGGIFIFIVKATFLRIPLKRNNDAAFSLRHDFLSRHSAHGFLILFRVGNLAPCGCGEGPGPPRASPSFPDASNLTESPDVRRTPGHRRLPETKRGSPGQLEAPSRPTSPELTSGRCGLGRRWGPHPQGHGADLHTEQERREEGRPEHQNGLLFVCFLNHTQEEGKPVR